MYRKSIRRLVIWTACGALLALPGSAGSQTQGSLPPPLAVSPEPADFDFREPTPTSELYRAWGEAFGIAVTFDPRMKSRAIGFQLRDVTALEALRVLNLSTGHFAVALDEKAILVADDTPQNRRTYETLVIRTFVLEHIEVKDAMTVVRSLLGAKHVAAHEELNAIILNDVIDKVRIAEQLLRVLDKPRAEAAIEVEVFHLAGRRRDAVAARLRRAGDDRRIGFPQRLSGEQLDDLRAAASLLTAPTLNVFSGEKGSWKLEDSYTVPTAGGAELVRIGLALEVSAQVKAASSQVEIKGSLSARDTLSAQPTGPVTASRETQWSARLGKGESLLLSGFLGFGRTAGGRDRGPRRTSFFDPSASDHGEILIALTPRIVAEPGYGQKDLEPICVGTEANLRLCGPF